MDRPIEKKRWSRRRLAILAGVFIGLSMVVSVGMANFGKTRQSVDAARVVAAEVHRAEFQEYAVVTGTVQPIKTFYVDLQEGGIVDKMYVQSGDMVKKGDLILVLANTAAQRDYIESETRLLENLNSLRNSKINLTQSNSVLRDQLLDIEYKIIDADAKFNRYTKLMNDPTPYLSKEMYETARDQADYYKNKRDLLRDRISKETALKDEQSRQIDFAVSSVNRSMEMLEKIGDSLNVRAPVGGQLSTFSAEVGQSFVRGQRVGQIDQLDSFKVRADIDQYYISKVAVGQKGRFELGGANYELQVAKIYPEVKNGVFQADLDFAGTLPAGIKRGQTLRIDVSLGESKMTNVVDKGGFYRHTNGRWVYLLSPDGRTAVKKTIVLGRQNPQSVEVLDGLKTGDRIIASDYDGFNDVDELSLSDAVRQ